MADLNQAKFLYFKTSAAYEAAKANMAVGAIAFDAVGKHIYVKAAAEGASLEYWIGGDIINNLLSDDASAKLSAAQGKVLKGLIDAADSSITGIKADITGIKEVNTHQDSSLTALDASVKDYETRVGAIEILDTKMQAAIVAVAKACAANELEGFSGDYTVDISAGSVDASTVDGSIMQGVQKAKIRVRIKEGKGIAQDASGIYVDGTKLTGIPMSGVTGLDSKFSDVCTRIDNVESSIAAEVSARETADASEASARAAAISAEASARELADASLESKKVDKETGKSLIANTEITRLAGMETGAQVNKIETVKVNGTALTITDKAVDITVPAATVTGVKSGDKLLKLDSDTTLLDTSIYMEYVSGDKKIYLYGIDGHESSANAICNIDCTDFVKDGMIEDVSLRDGDDTHPTADGPYIVITWNAVSEKSVIWLSVKKLVDVYTVHPDSANYLDISSYKVGAKVEVENGLAGYNHLVKTDASLADVSSRFATAKTNIESSLGILAAKDVEIDSSIVRIDGSLNRLDGDINTVGSIKKQIYDASTASEGKLVGSEGDASTANTIYGAKKYAAEVAEAAGKDVSVKVTASGDTAISLSGSSSKSGNVTTINITAGATDALEAAIANANAALQKIKVNGTEITPDSSAVNITVETGDANGQIKVAGQNIDVKGLGSAAYTTVAALETTMDTKDNTVKTTLVGSAGDASTANTIYAAKKYAKEYTDAATAWYIEA